MTVEQLSMELAAYISSILFFASLVPKSLSHCSHGQWKCDSGDCILRENVCDTLANCPDASDESVCADRDTCEDFLFQCKSSRQCLSQVKVSNGQAECQDNSDEELKGCDREDFVHVDNSKQNSVQSRFSSTILILMTIFCINLI